MAGSFRRRLFINESPRQALFSLNEWEMYAHRQVHPDFRKQCTSAASSLFMTYLESRDSTEIGSLCLSLKLDYVLKYSRIADR